MPLADNIGKQQQHCGEANQYSGETVDAKALLGTIATAQGLPDLFQVVYRLTHTALGIS